MFLSDFHIALGLIVPILDHQSRGALACASRSCRDACEEPGPCDAATVTLPEPPGSKFEEWLAAHPVDTLVVKQRLPVAQDQLPRFLSAVIRVARVLKACPARRVEVHCLVGEPHHAISHLALAGAREVVCVDLTPQFIYGLESRIRIPPSVELLDLRMCTNILRFTGAASGLRELRLSSRQYITHVVPPQGGFPLLEAATLDNVCFRRLVPPELAPRLHTLTIGDVAGPWPDFPPEVANLGRATTDVLLSPRARLEVTAGMYRDPHSLVGLPITHLKMVTPFSFCFPWGNCAMRSSLEYLEMDMQHAMSDEFSFDDLRLLPALHTLRLVNICREETVSIARFMPCAKPPSLRRIEVETPCGAVVSVWESGDWQFDPTPVSRDYYGVA